MTVLVTGGAGFIGSHLVDFFIGRGDEVRAFDNLSAGTLSNIDIRIEEPNFNFVKGDLLRPEEVNAAIKGCDVLFHLAANPEVRSWKASPEDHFRQNIEGTYNILQASRELKNIDVLITSTSETYGSAQYVPIDEKHPMVGQSPYSATKIAADHIALSYFRSFELPIKIVRPFNTYGPRQSARAVIPTIIVQVLNGKRSLKLGSVSPTRDFTYVEDTARGFIAIEKNDSLFGEITNIGSGTEISIKALTQEIAKIADCKIHIKSDGQRIRPEKSEVSRLLCDNKKIKSATDWRPEFSFENGLRKTFDWFKSRISLYKSDIYNI